MKAHQWYGMMLTVVVTVLLTACNNSEPETPQVTAAVSPTPASAIQGYGGPLLGSVTGQEEAQADCTADSGCAIQPVATAERREDSLPLTVQTVGDFELGLPAGYSPLILEDEILITAVDATTPGGYTFSLRRVTPADLTRQLARFDNPDLTTGFALNWPLGTGYWLKVGEDSAIGLLEGANGQIFIEAFTYQGAWPAFESTFVAMTESLSPTD